MRSRVLSGLRENLLTSIRTSVSVSCPPHEIPREPISAIEMHLGIGRKLAA